MMNKRIYFLGIPFFALSLWAQEPLEAGLTEQVEAIAASIKEHPQTAAEGFDNLLKGKNKKNVSLLVAIGDAYLTAGNIQEAGRYAQRAADVDNKAPQVYLLQGDIALAENDPGTACGNYEQAILFDEDCKEAYYKYAHAYAGVNPQLSVDMLLKLKARFPEELQTDRELANVYYQMGDYSRAKTAFDAFMQAGKPEVQDYGRYAMLLYLNKDYRESMDMVEKGLSMDAQYHLLKRLKMYDLYELKAYEEALKASQEFLAQKEGSFVYLDYVYQGRICEALKQTEPAVAAFKQALAADTQGEHPEIWKEMSGVYEAAQNYPQAVEAFQHYADCLNGKMEVSDLFLLGRLYYLSASATEDMAQKTAALTKADEIFAQVAQRVPTNYLGNFWRARVNSLLDPETSQGLAKPYYEAALALLSQQPQASQSLMIECESYLGYYYFLQKDYEQSKEHWRNILKLDPEHAAAKQALEGMK